jgi:alanyl-tRNA synthetase
VLQGKRLKKAVYVFSLDQSERKVAHANYVPESVRTKGLDARTWASKVTDIIGGKVKNSLFFLECPR